MIHLFSISYVTLIRDNFFAIMSDSISSIDKRDAEGSVPSALRHYLGWIAAAVIILLLVADQVIKIWVKTHFYLGEDYEICSWFHLRFIENNGMAFGLELWNKLLLTFGRIVAVAGLIWCLRKAIAHTELRSGFVIALAMITAGAAGNIFDCIFYGVIFDAPFPPQVASLCPDAGGYANWFEGRVVDMFYFPFFDFYWPEWVPFVGGSYFEFFAYIFNVADASICVGLALMLFFYNSNMQLAFSLADNKLKRLFHKSDSKSDSK